MTVSPLGDSAVVIAISEKVDAETAVHVRALAAEIGRMRLSGVVDVVPAFGSVAVFFDPALAAPFDALSGELQTTARRVVASADVAPGRGVEIPVCYGGEYGPDLELVGIRLKKPAEEVVALHARAGYVVHAIGFAPGFPYLGGLPPDLAVPRRDTPRPRVPAGSVGIGGTQTGIYPLETPGGWNLIGRTPLSLFDASRPEPSLLQAGDRVTFRPITSDEFVALRRFETSGNSGVSSRSRADEQGERVEGGGMKQADALWERVPGIEVVRAGMFTTVQDLGRGGHRARGVPLSGAADGFALRVANLLVGNQENEAGLEFALVGPELKFLHDTIIAIGGAEFGRLPRWRPIAVTGGTTVKIGPARNGCRGYLAVAGGIDIVPVLGSRSTYVRARLGGHQGRRLMNGDVLPVPDVRRGFRNHWRIDERIMPRYSSFAVVRVIPGEHAEQFEPGWTSSVFKVSAQSDRMGVRMMGEPVRRVVAGDLPSSPVAPGTVQVPPDGQPIILLADAQTIGGYPQVAHVIAVDLPVVAQLRPGDEVRFILVTLGDARELIAARERAIGLLREGLAQKFAGT
ncbi:MAG: 5-oxoprolinase subunit PxpB [Opitutaceae bacterium]